MKLHKLLFVELWNRIMDECAGNKFPWESHRWGATETERIKIRPLNLRRLLCLGDPPSAFTETSSSSSCCRFLGATTHQNIILCFLFGGVEKWMKISYSLDLEHEISNNIKVEIWFRSCRSFFFPSLCSSGSSETFFCEKKFHSQHSKHVGCTLFPLAPTQGGGVWMENNVIFAKLPLMEIIFSTRSRTEMFTACCWR